MLKLISSSCFRTVKGKLYLSSQPGFIHQESFSKQFYYDGNFDASPTVEIANQET